MGFSSLKKEEIENLFNYLRRYDTSSKEEKDEMMQELAKKLLESRDEVICRKKHPRPRMTLGVSYVSKLSHHWEQCKVAERYLKDKLDEHDFSWLPELTMQAEELWRMFQEEFEIKKNNNN